MTSSHKGRTVSTCHECDAVVLLWTIEPQWKGGDMTQHVLIEHLDEPRNKKPAWVCPHCNKRNLIR